jgi:CRISPR-associated protein Cmr6
MNAPFCDDVRLPAEVENPGLALSRFVPWPKDNAARGEFFQAIAKIPTGDAYRAVFTRWQRYVESRADRAVIITASLGGPLAVGLGNESPYEVGLTLHRTYGVPMIPGSAVKGACRRALEHLPSGADRDTAVAQLFGDTEHAGRAVFHDAWFDPAGGDPLAVDTVTVHHRDYYRTRGAGGTFPTDFDDPNPVAFVSVPADARFLFAVEIPGASPDWLRFAEGMLRHTLTEIGLGGKTNAGYGWFDPDSIVAAERPRLQTVEEALSEIQSAIDRLDASGLGGNAVSLLDRAQNPQQRLRIAQALQARAAKIGRWDKKTDGKSWRTAIEEALRG